MKTRFSLTVLAIFAILLMACGASATSTPPPSSTPPPTNTPTSAPPSQGTPTPADAPAGETSGQGAQAGDKVSVHYTGTLDDGTVFDTSRERGTPLEFTIGEGQVIEGFDKGVIGMKGGETKTIHIPVDQAYGPHREELVREVDRSELPETMEPQVGAQVRASTPDGQTVIFTITDINGSTVTLDANHRLAGKDLNFEIEMLAIN